MAILPDSSTPVPLGYAGSPASPVVSNVFSPPSGSLVVVGISANGGSGAVIGPTGVSDGTNTYTQLNALPFSTRFAALYCFYYASAPGAIQVQATIASAPSQGIVMVPVVLTGCASTQNGAVGTPASGLTWTTSTTVADASAGTAPIVAGAGVVGAGIPANDFISSVVAGVSFDLNAAPSSGGSGILTIGGFQAFTGLPSTFIQTTASGSQVFMMVCNDSNSTGPTAASGQTFTFNGNSSSITENGNRGWLQALSSPAGASGTLVNLNDTAPSVNTAAVAVEILAATGGAAPTPSTFSVSDPTLSRIPGIH